MNVRIRKRKLKDKFFSNITQEKNDNYSVSCKDGLKERNVLELVLTNMEIRRLKKG